MANVSTSISGARTSSAHRARVVQVVSGLEIAHGGPSYSVPRLNDALVGAGIDGRVFADLISGEPANNHAPTVETFDRQFGTAPILGKLHLSGPMKRRLLNNGDGFEIIHSHGLWRMPNIYAARAARRHGIPHLISPRGMMSDVALSFSHRSKRLFWSAMQSAAMREAACVHATSMAEHDEIRTLGITRPIAVIPNGVDLPSGSCTRPSARQLGERQRTLLHFGRIHPKKGLDILLAAWATVAPAFPTWSLRIVGPGDREHIAELKRQIDAMRVPRVTFEGPVYGDAKWEVYRSADLFVLPTLNENFGLTVAESLACCRPVIVTKGAPWFGVIDHRCGWWVDTGKQALTDALSIGLATPDEELDAMGRRGETWVREAFSWDNIGRQMADVYRWVLGRGSQPSCVVLA